MNDGIKPAHRKTLIEILAANPKVEQVVLFGSRALGNHRPNSDIDLALYGKALDLDDLPRFQEEIEATTIPHQVDLLLINRIGNERLRRHVEKEGVAWFRRTPSSTTVAI